MEIISREKSTEGEVTYVSETLNYESSKGAKGKAVIKRPFLEEYDQGLSFGESLTESVSGYK